MDTSALLSGPRRRLRSVRANAARRIGPRLVLLVGLGLVGGDVVAAAGASSPGEAAAAAPITRESWGTVADPSLLARNFATPPAAHRPETWFHLIGGNVSRAGLTTDLEAIAAAGIAGIQLFHGSGRAWPGVAPQIQTLSPSWDGMIAHVANETRRLGLRFTMQNCPGWAMSGGPWITPDKAMRHLVTSRQEVAGGGVVRLALARPQPSDDAWRDYRDVAVLAFPTPEGAAEPALQPIAVTSNRPGDWAGLLAGKKNVEVTLAPGPEPAWLEVAFAQPATLRSVELPPIELLMMRRNFDPGAHIALQIPEGAGWKELVRYAVPRGTWQDRQPEYPYVLAVPEATSSRYRLVWEHAHPLTLSYLRLSSAAKLHDWCGQAGYALRSLERTPPARQSRAAWIDPETIVDLSARMDAAGRLEWVAPSGRWTVVRFGHVNTGAKNKPAPPEATGFECDKFAAAGAEQHFAGYIGRLTAPGGPADGGRLQGMLVDSWECFTQTWTPAMEREFEQRRGYGLRRWLPALAGWVVAEPATTERFLRDWRATIDDLLVEHYFGRLAELGRTRGLTLSFETAIGDVSPGDILRYFGRADIPMCEFWQPNDPHQGGLETKPIAPTVSAAHIYGKRRVAAEAFTNVPNRWDVHPFALKHFADRNFALGITRLVFHTYTHNPLDRVPGTSFGSAIGTAFLRGQTWWRYLPHVTTYLARCQFLLEQGHPVADVLWYLGDDLDHKPRQDLPFPAGYRFDYLNAEVLQQRIQVREGRLQIPEGTTWRVLWLAREQCRRLTPATLERLRDLLQAGATIIGEAPTANPSLSGGPAADRAFTRLVRELWGDRGEAAGERRIGAGRLLWGGDLATCLQRLGLTPDVRGARSATWCHRRVGDADVYFLAAERASPLSANLHFRAKGRPEYWDALTGKSTPVGVYHQDADGTTIALDLPAAGSVFVVFRQGPADAALVRLTRDGQPVLDATDPSRRDGGAPYPHFGLAPGLPLQPWIEPAPLTAEVLDGGRRLLAWVDGEYAWTRASAAAGKARVAGTRAVRLERGWSLAFPPGWEAPASLALDPLQPWSELRDPATRAFSGSATYRTLFRLDPLQPEERVVLDLGRVGDIAAVRLNGRDVAVRWTAPFRVDLTAASQAGDNELEVTVTNTWHNRLAYEAGRPEAERKTWTFNPPNAHAPREFAGLGGPVYLRIGQVVELTPP